MIFLTIIIAYKNVWFLKDDPIMISKHAANAANILVGN